MKKRLLSIGGVALAGIALASCSGGKITYTEITPESISEKGNTVSEVHIDLKGSYGREIKYDLNNQMKFSEVAEALEGSFSNYVGDEISAYSYSYKKADDYTSENDYEFKSSVGFIPKGKETVKSESYSSLEEYKKVTTADKSTTTRVYKSSLMYQKNDSSTSNSNTSTVYKYEVKNAKDYKITSGDVVEEDMKYAYSSSTEMNGSAKSKKENGTTTTSSSKSYYISASEKSTDTDYDKVYESYDIENKDEVTYEISSTHGINVNTFSSSYSVSISSAYNANLDDLYTTSYELTDKYIILKGDCNFTQEVYEKAYAKAVAKHLLPSSAQIKDELNALIEGEYKGSKSSCELWIKYDKKSIGFAYYKLDYTTNYNISRQYEASDFTSEFGYDAEAKYAYDYKDLVGKQFNKKGKSSSVLTISTSENGFDDKTNKLFTNCEKDNDYKDLKFVAVDDNYLF